MYDKCNAYFVRCKTFRYFQCYLYMKDTANIDVKWSNIPEVWHSNIFNTEIFVSVVNHSYILWYDAFLLFKL